MIINQFIIETMPEHIREFAIDSAYCTRKNDCAEFLSFDIWPGYNSEVVHQCKYYYATGVFEWVTVKK